MSRQGLAARYALPTLVLLPLVHLSCGGSGGGSGGGGGGGTGSGGAFTLFSTHFPVDPGAKIAFSGSSFVLLTSEDAIGSAGADLNADADTMDSIAIVVDTVTKVETNLATAVDDMIWMGPNLYLVVNEFEDTKDWNGDGDGNADDFSLLHWTAGLPQPVFVASIETGGAVSFVVTSERLFFAEKPTAAPGLGLTSFRQIDIAAPEVALPVPTTSDAPNGLQPRVLGIDETLVFALASELVDGVDLNADGDAIDEHVLLLIDGRASNPSVGVTGLGLRGPDAAFRADDMTPGDWMVAVLVSEAAHIGTGPLAGAFTGFNDPALFDPEWAPAQCFGHADTDTNDDVLFWIHYAEWAADPVGHPPQNTGLVGTSRVVAQGNSSYPQASSVGTVSLESDEGCDLNFDGDVQDSVVRWVQATLPVLPRTHWSNLLALVDEAEIPGGTAGFVHLEGGGMTVLCDEAADGEDHDDSADYHRLFAKWRGNWWDFTHYFTHYSLMYGGAKWMTETFDRRTLLAAISESVEGFNLNTLGTDSDTNDCVPAIVEPYSGPGMHFLVFPYATPADNPGIVLAGDTIFYRVSEADDSKDWNGDGDQKDLVLFRTDLASDEHSGTHTAGNSWYMGVANNLPRAVVDVDTAATSPLVGAVVSSEDDAGKAGTDYDGDGDKDDYVVRWFQF